MSAPPPRGANGMGVLPGWAELEPALPQIAATMRRYLTQISCVLRPGSVQNADQALQCFATFLAQAALAVTSIAQVTRAHIEDYKLWLAARPGQNKPQVTTATLAHRLGTLRMFFVRLDEWGWGEAPPRVPMFAGDLPRQDHPLPKALDGAAVAKLPRAASRERAHMPLQARSVRPRSVDVGAVLDGYYGDSVLVLVDAVDHAVITTARAVQPFEA